MFCPYVILSAVSGYWHISLIAMGGIAQGTDIARRNLINVVLVFAFFVYSQCIHEYRALLYVIIIIIAIIILLAY